MSAFFEKIRHFKFKLYRRCYAYRFRILYDYFPEYVVGENITGPEEFFYTAVYKDETWNYVRQIDRIFRLRSLGVELHVEDNHCPNGKIVFVPPAKYVIRSSGVNKDWIYWFTDKNPGDKYLLNLNTVVHTKFTEFQIAFKHSSILKRYRFRVIDNEKLAFEVVHNGFFFDELKVVPCSFDFGRKHNVKVIVYQHVYMFMLDNKLLMAVEDKGKVLKEGGVALIFWHNVEKSNIDLEIEDLNIYNVL